jgi:hypothetical protein
VQFDRHFDLFRRKASVGTKNAELLIHGPMGEPYD